MTANELKKLVTQVRRTDTALRHLACQLRLNDADKSALLKAASVLSSSSRFVASQATQSKRMEDARERAVTKATQQAKQLMESWPVTTILDKVALCIGNLMESNLRRDLESDPADLEWSLSYWVEQALSEIPASAAWKAVRDDRPVSELMAQARERLEKVRDQPVTIALAERWRSQMEKGVQNA